MKKIDGHPLGVVVGFAIAGLLASLLSVAVDGAPLSAVPLWASVLAVVASTLAVVLRAATRSRLSVVMAGAIGCWLLLLGAIADTAYVKIFGAHLGRDALVLGWDAWRNSIFRIGLTDVAAMTAAAGVLLVLVYAGFGLTARLPRLDERRERLLRRSARTAAAGLLGIVVFRDLVLPPNAPWARPFFWHNPLVQRELRERAESKIGVHFGEELDDAQARALVRASKDLQQHRFAVTAERKPDILFVHVESLRADMLTAERMPKLFAWSKRCATSPRHYSTSNATGGGAFGALSGLTATYFSRSRRDQIVPLPLRVLAGLGYERSVWYPNEALGYDHLRDVLFADLAEAHIADREPVHEADALSVDGYLRSLGNSGEARAPRFDYLVLDSTHYDYAYPEAFAKNLPVAGLSSTLNRRTGEGKAVDPLDANARQGGGLFNRYKNAVLYVDSLVDRLLVGLETRRRLDGTIIAIFGDHGEAFWDRDDSFGHSNSLIDAQTRVPFVFCSTPTIAIDYRVTSHADIFPTVFELAGVRAERPFMTGKSLARYVSGLDYAIVRYPVTSGQYDPRHAIVLGGYKVAYVDEVDPRALWVRDSNDDIVTNPPEDLVTTSLGTAISAKLFREPRGL